MGLSVTARGRLCCVLNFKSPNFEIFKHTNTACRCRNSDFQIQLVVSLSNFRHAVNSSYHLRFIS